MKKKMDVDKELNKLREKRYREMVLSCKMLIAQIQNCLNDDFKSYHDSDIDNWIRDLNDIKRESEDLKLKLQEV